MEHFLEYFLLTFGCWYRQSFPDVRYNGLMDVLHPYIIPCISTVFFVLRINQLGREQAAQVILDSILIGFGFLCGEKQS